MAFIERTNGAETVLLPHRRFTANPSPPVRDIAGDGTTFM